MLAGLLALTALAYAVVRRPYRPIDDIRACALRYGGAIFPAASPCAGRTSHELRSPLTRARWHAEWLAEGHERTAPLRDLGQMRDLVGDLLEGERLAAGSAALQREATD